MNILHALQNVAHLLQAGCGATGQVNLGDIAGDDHLRTEAQAGQEHLHLLGGGVLRLVEDDERVVEGAAAHVRQRCDLNGARLHELGDGFGLEHVVQRVVERAQVRVNLLVEGAGQEAQTLAGLHGGAGEDNAVHLVALQRLHSLRHGEVGLTGTRRADTEDHGVRVDGVHVLLLVNGLGANRGAAGGQDARRQRVRRVAQFVTEHAHEAVDHLNGNLRVVAGEHAQLVQQLCGGGDGLGGAGDEHVQVLGAQANLLEVVLDDAQVRVLRAEHGNHLCGAFEGYGACGRQRSGGSHMGSLASDVFTSIDVRDASRPGRVPAVGFYRPGLAAALYQRPSTTFRVHMAADPAVEERSTSSPSSARCAPASVKSCTSRSLIPPSGPTSR